MATLDRIHRFRKVSSSVILGGAMLMGLASCAPNYEPETVPDQVAPQPEVAPVLVPGGSAEENLPFFADVLSQYAAGSEAVAGQPVVNTLVAAGFDRASMQVSFDQSKTGLTADSIFVSVRINEECLVGQLVSADRSTHISMQPALTESKNICLIGTTRPIDW